MQKIKKKKLFELPFCGDCEIGEKNGCCFCKGDKQKI
jgi:hypothetical protein